MRGTRQPLRVLAGVTLVAGLLVLPVPLRAEAGERPAAPRGLEVHLDDRGRPVVPTPSELPAVPAPPVGEPEILPAPIGGDMILVDPARFPSARSERE